jgi:ribosomal protein L24E
MSFFSKINYCCFCGKRIRDGRGVQLSKECKLIRCWCSEKCYKDFIKKETTKELLGEVQT